MDDCACSGIRRCLLCEDKKDFINAFNTDASHKNKIKTLMFCIKCQELCSTAVLQDDYLGKSEETCSKHDCIFQIMVSGITVIEDFITKSEEEFMVEEIEKFPWRVSQSGRQKQDFGPKVNFKKKKLKTGNFTGLPSFIQFIVKRIHKDILQLHDFHPIELCNLDYSPERGAAIDPHIDDTWLWGERLVTINLLSDTVLTLTNLEKLYEIRIPMPRYSLVILQGDARHVWMHGIKREDIKSRRIAITLRELSAEFLSGEGYTRTGKPLLELAESYNGLPTST
ncbi:alpha-ketoglutarate-dependent dioxygenase alkB homolog 4-like [Dendronephthya gigantea]|uniref:alpha-ketoglutarate-dependent dioxygenase alkB homolog 4-like n=1 Tax=Dendronephthya gigantea TaxID=151771 RepID=UPI00106ABD9C|nr:alpha-ketoglutarate-dependent dioxygenase alkB homolog 4-like [Dendronephthya gigantea]